MPYSFPNNIPKWASKQSDPVKKIAVSVFNSTFKDTKDEQKAMAASMKAMVNARDSFKKKSELLVKSEDPQLKQVTYVVMIPDEVDAHGDVASCESVRLAKESFNRALVNKQKLENLFHLKSTNTYSVIESYLAPCDMILNGHLVKKSTWLMTLQVNSDDLWEMVMKGDVVGLSIGAYAEVEEIEDEK